MAARAVASGILLSRVLGFVREAVFAHFFGNSAPAGAYRAALRIPNVIRNLLGEGTLSASFIPVYAGLLATGDRAGARALAGAVVGLLTLVTAFAALAGVVLAPIITTVVAPGFDGPTRDLTVTLVRILFPMSGLMILSAWCLGILNAHGRFFLSYAAPALWNVAQIAVLVVLGGTLLGVPLVIALAWGALAGGALQFGAQLPGALRAAGAVRPTLDVADPAVRRVIGAWLPVVVGAGVVQLSSVIDTQLGSVLGPSAVAQLGYAQLIAILPVSLFGVSVAAAALPALSREAAVADTTELRARIARGLRRIAFYVIPTAFAFATIGTVLVGLLYQRGAFDPADTAVVSAILAAYAIGILAQASVKLLASGFYAMGDTRTPVRCAIIAVVVAAGTGLWLMQYLLAAGIALGAAIGAWVNVLLLATLLQRRVGPVFPSGERGPLLLVGLASGAAAAAGWGVMRGLGGLPPVVLGAVAVPAFAAVYLIIVGAGGHAEARALRVR